MVGLTREEFAGLMGALGYRRRVITPVRAANMQATPETPHVSPAPPSSIIAFQWKGHMTKHQSSQRTAAVAALPLDSSKQSGGRSVAARQSHSPFAALASLKVAR
jgi:hypothetical protein